MGLGFRGFRVSGFQGLGFSVMQGPKYLPILLWGLVTTKIVPYTPKPYSNYQGPCSGHLGF